MDYKYKPTRQELAAQVQAEEIERRKAIASGSFEVTLEK